MRAVGLHFDSSCAGAMMPCMRSTVCAESAPRHTHACIVHFSPAPGPVVLVLVLLPLLVLLLLAGLNGQASTA